LRAGVEARQAGKPLYFNGDSFPFLQWGIILQIGLESKETGMIAARPVAPPLTVEMTFRRVPDRGDLHDQLAATKNNPLKGRSLE
jgi:hypothetical protein